MKVALSRRMFLQGAGGVALAIPTLSSLLPRAARAQATDGPPVRYVQWITDHGQFAARYWPSAEHTPSEPATVDGQQVAGVKTRALSAIPGRLSEVLGPAFDPLRGKLNLLRGLDLMVKDGFHNACAPTCASWPRQDNHVPFFSHSVDAVLSASKMVYPSAARVPALRLTPGVNSSYKWGSFCWTMKDAKPFKLPCHDSNRAALGAVFGVDTQASGDPSAASRVHLVDRVLEDYRGVVGRGSLSSADKQQLANYMDLLSELQQRMSIEAPACMPPAQLTESDFDVLHKNATDIAVASMLCGATRVVAYHCYQGAPKQYDEETFHAWAHNDAASHAKMMTWRYQQLARLLTTMDSFTEANGQTLLDNSVLYASNELSDPGHGKWHLQNMPVITAGSAGGKLVTGQYIDFGKRLLNNLLVTLFHTMGVTAAEYQRNGVVGFGDYAGNNAELYEPYLSDVERQRPLPFLYRG